jgi:hypothetical protein
MQRLSPLLAVVFVSVCWGAEPEPTFEEKMLGQWTAQAKDHDPRLRGQAAQALGKMGADAKAAPPILTEMLRDPVIDVRLAAAETLGKMGPPAQSAASACLLEVLRSKAEEARDNLDLARHRLYISDMRLAQRAWEEDHLDRLAELLDAHQPRDEQDTDLRAFEWDYWHRQTRFALLTLSGHTADIAGIAFSPDGKLLASAGGELRVWDIGNGQRSLRQQPVRHQDLGRETGPGVARVEASGVGWRAGQRSLQR